MTKQISSPRGMRDFLPVEKARRDQYLEKILAVYKSRGFQSIETPAMEAIERLLSGQGGDNEKLAFQVLKRGEELNRALQDGSVLADLGLRYDLTVPLTRFYATNHADLPRVFKAVQTGPVWRAERPQKGRYRQFNQCDIDVIGDDSTDAELELLSASLEALESIGLSSARIRINHRGYLVKEMQRLGVEDVPGVLVTVDKLDKIGISGVTQELSQQYDKSLAERIEQWISQDSQIPEQLSEIVDFFDGSKLRFDKTLVRGMGYYTGAVFEIEHPESGQSIGGGGRYDGMVGKWMGSDVAAVGISLGFERVMDFVGQIDGEQKSLVIVYQQIENALAIQRQAIAEGFQCRLEKKTKNLKSLLESMSEQGFEQFALLDGQPNLSELTIKSLN